jgi:uncharacterized membrane protein HdeD (DUF308 family)
MLDAIRRKHQRTWWTFIVRGVLALVVGVLMLTRPADSLAVLALLVAVWALVSGVSEIIHSFQLRTAFGSWWILLIAGVISAGFGAVALYDYPALSLAFLAVWAGLWLGVTGALGILSSMHFRRSGIPWGWTCAWGVVSVTASFAAFIDPPATLAAILALLAAFAIVSGTALLGAAWHIKSIGRHIAAVVHPADASSK